MTRNEALERALRELERGESLVNAIRDAYDAGYHQGGVDWQRMRASEVRPSRKRKRRGK